MYYRKLFLLIAFAPLGLLLFVGDAQSCWWCDPPDGGYNPWGGWSGGGSVVACQIGFGDAVSASNLNSGTATITSVNGKTFPCTVDGNSGEGKIAGSTGSITISGVQQGQCITTKSKKTSEREAFAKCGQSGADVEGTIEIKFSDSTTVHWNIGGVDALTNTGACNNSGLFGATGPFEKNEIFTANVTYNNLTCAGAGNDAKTNFRSCTGPVGQPAVCVPDDTVHTMTASFDQIFTVGASCRTPFNQTSCSSDPSGVIKVTIDGTTTNIAEIDKTSLKCGDPDNPFKVPAVGSQPQGVDLVVTCPRCFNGQNVFAADGTLAVTANAGDGALQHLIGGICSGNPVSG